ncbi:hypothetical protein CPB84DRAFT_1473740 [Gymnopilus junonius]|uniref:Transmembrane protein n=1 Tax=Gymnopilus junonius TaxID=109634 RepID=A0A9P5NFS0_GYMJU|nr:hypothetical protein CPB84DRAFT_1473740 [Gymnopilus junonius]
MVLFRLRCTLSFQTLSRCLRFLIFTLLLDRSLSGALAEQNVTIDDQNPSIVYSPPGAWTVSTNSSLDFGGSHTLAQNPNATALFNFTGTAIYFFSPLWPYLVNTAISLDEGPITLVDLVDHSRNDTVTGPETVQSHVVWNATGLNYTRHLLNISVGAGQPFAVVDGLIYTTPNDTVTSPSVPSSSSTSSTSTTSISRVVASPTSNSSSDLSSSSPSRHIVPVALGTILGILAIFLLMFAMWFFFRRRRRPVSEAWTLATGTSARRQPPPQKGTTWYKTPPTPPNVPGYPMEQTAQGTWLNGKYAYVGNMPPPPISALSPPVPGMGNYNQPEYAAPVSPSARAPNRYQPGYTLSTITEKSTPQSRKTPLSANSPASAQSELGGGGHAAGYYSPPPAAPSEVMSETSTIRGPGLAGIGAAGGYGGALLISRLSNNIIIRPDIEMEEEAEVQGRMLLLLQ